jgi:hypothetical protein
MSMKCSEVHNDIQNRERRHCVPTVGFLSSDCDAVFADISKELTAFVGKEIVVLLLGQL